MTEAQRHQILLDMLAQLGFVTVENVMKAANSRKSATAQKPLPSSDRAGRQ